MNLSPFMGTLSLLGPNISDHFLPLWLKIHNQICDNFVKLVGFFTAEI